VTNDVRDDESTCNHVSKPEDCTNDCCSITLSVIIRDTLTHYAAPDIPTIEEASTDSPGD
jgi:hypothetical protein